MKRFILNADDIGKSEAHNLAAAEGFKYGILKSVSVMANMPFYNDALWNVIRPNPLLGVGVHLNIIEGCAINKDLNLLCGKNGNFNNSYLQIILKSYSKEFLFQLETEFRSQIERCILDFRPTHIDSHAHIHAIPNIFELVCKLANEYDIKRVRTQNEIFYRTDDGKYDKKVLFVNFFKFLLLKYFTSLNKSKIKKYNLETNDYLTGILYNSMMNSSTILDGLKAAKKDDAVIEAIIHPCKYTNEDIADLNSLIEYSITKDEMLKDLIEKNLEFKITNYCDIIAR